MGLIAAAVAVPALPGEARQAPQLALLREGGKGCQTHGKKIVWLKSTGWPGLAVGALWASSGAQPPRGASGGGGLAHPGPLPYPGLLWGGGSPCRALEMRLKTAGGAGAASETATRGGGVGWGGRSRLCRCRWVPPLIRRGFGGVLLDPLLRQRRLPPCIDHRAASHARHAHRYTG